MATVYEAADLRLSSVVALKEMHIESEMYSRAFEREAALLANLRHPSLPIVTDHFSERDGQYLVMQYISGSDLAEMLESRGAPFAPADVLRWGEQLLDALEYLHGHEPPVIHRDIKPSNLKISQRGEIILLDFGLAKGAAGQMTALSTSRSVLGYTPVYASLEQIHGAGTDPRSDLYSLGATLYHLMTNVVPVDAPTRFLALEEDRPDPLRPADEVCTEVRPAVSNLLRRAMAVSRKDRYASATEMRRSLREASARMEPTATRPGEPGWTPTTPSSSGLEADKSSSTIAAPTTPAPRIDSGASVREEPYENRAPYDPREQRNQKEAPVVTNPQLQTVMPTLTAAMQSVPLNADTLGQGQAEASKPSSGAPAASSRKLKLWPLAALGAGFLIVAVIGILAFFYINSGQKSSGGAPAVLKPEDRGRILDRSGEPQRALALNQKDSDGKLTRVYPLDSAMAHLIGGDSRLEHALFDANNGVKAGTDIRLTIDRNLQQAAADQLKGKSGAVIILNPQTGEVLAMYSNPSYSIKDSINEETWKKLVANKRDNATANRVLDSYYVPGASFMTFTMLAAFIAGQQNHSFTATSGGYIAEPGARAIMDDNGSCESCGTINLLQAYQISSNQYFANLAVTLGADGLKKAGQLTGLGTYNNTSGEGQGQPAPELWNASTEAVRRAVAPAQSWIMTNPKTRRYDLALQGFGQRYAGQMTPFQMALFVSAIGNMEGKLMKPRIEYNRPSEAYNQVVSPQAAAAMRRIMQSVAEGGTATAAMSPVKSAGISVGAKTGTAQKNVPVYDPKTGAPKTKTVQQRNPQGNIIREYEDVVLDENPRIDGLFLCLAPLEQPQIAMVVVVEGGGYSSRSAAPIAAMLILKAKELGLLKSQ